MSKVIFERVKDDWTPSLARLKTGMKTAGPESLRVTGESMEVLGKAIVHVLTGRLQSTIQAEIEATEMRFKAGGQGVDYARPVEFGHTARNGRFVGPFPFMRPAWDAYKEMPIQIIRRIIGAL